MKKKRFIAILSGVALITAVGGAAGAWLLLKPEALSSLFAATDKREFRYVSLDKVIVMLRGQQGGPLSNYLAVDLVFMTSVEGEMPTKMQLPLLRSIAVRALSDFTLEQASMLSIAELAAHVQKAYDESYSAESRKKPFSEVLIGKLIIE